MKSNPIMEKYFITFFNTYEKSGSAKLTEKLEPFLQ